MKMKQTLIRMDEFFSKSCLTYSATRAQTKKMISPYCFVLILSSWYFSEINFFGGNFKLRKIIDKRVT